MNYIVTLPKNYNWQTYLNEIKFAQENGFCLFFRVPFFPKDIDRTSRIYITHRNKVRGYMMFHQCLECKTDWPCDFTGKV